MKYVCSKKALAITAIAVVILLSLWMALGYAVVYIALSPHPGEVPAEITLGGLQADNVAFTAEDGVNLSAWWLGKNTDRAVILLSGISADRRQGKSKAEIFLQEGFDVLLPDLRGTGRSDPALVTIGWNETRDLKACFDHMRQRGYKHIGAYGLSLGAATIAYSFKQIPDFAFVVLESCYDTMTSAMNNRLDIVHIPHFVAWPVLFWGERQIGVSLKELQPVDFMQYCKAPALIISGDAERVLTESETRSLYEHCGSSLKRVHIFKNGTHSHLHKESPQEYRQTLKEFIQEVAAQWK